MPTRTMLLLIFLFSTVYTTGNDCVAKQKVAFTFNEDDTKVAFAVEDIKKALLDADYGVDGSAADLRIVYVPQARAVVVKQLAAQTQYEATWFDTVAGGSASLGKVITDEAGSWRSPPPDHKHDWVLVLNRYGGPSKR